MLTYIILISCKSFGISRDANDVLVENLINLYDYIYFLSYRTLYNFLTLKSYLAFFCHQVGLLINKLLTQTHC